MRSRIDWNEVVPKLDAGLRQTLYLAAMAMLSRSTEALEKRREYNRMYFRKYYQKLKSKPKRNYAAEYRRRKRLSPLAGKKHRKFTDKDFQKMAAYYKLNGHNATREHFKLGGTTIVKVKKIANVELA